MSVYRFNACPFCKSDDIDTGIDFEWAKQGDREYWFSYCKDCNAHGPLAVTEELAVLYWNDRGDDE